MHLNIMYELMPEQHIIKSKEAEARLNAANSDMERKKIAIDEKKAFIAAIKAEYDKIDHTVIRFCIFLKKSSITPYNDVALGYLAFMIREERGKVAVGGGATKLEDLERYRDQYQEKVKILTTRMQKGDDSVLLSEEEVYAEVKKLYSLKYYGQRLSQIKSIVNSAHSNTFREESHCIRAKAKRWTVTSMQDSGWRYVHSGFGSKRT